MHVWRGLRQALGALVLSLLASCVVGAGWTAWQGGGFARRTGLVAMLLAGLISLSGGTLLSRLVTDDARAFLGAGPDREEPSSGGHLTAVGVLLLVSAPLFLVGGTLATVR